MWRGGFAAGPVEWQVTAEDSETAPSDLGSGSDSVYSVGAVYLGLGEL